jgi:hypothetical protein
MVAVTEMEGDRMCQWIDWMGLCVKGRPPPEDPEEMRCRIIEMVACLHGNALRCTLCIVTALALPREVLCES